MMPPQPVPQSALSNFFDEMLPNHDQMECLIREDNARIPMPSISCTNVLRSCQDSPRKARDRWVAHSPAPAYDRFNNAADDTKPQPPPSRRRTRRRSPVIFCEPEKLHSGSFPQRSAQIPLNQFTNAYRKVPSPPVDSPPSIEHLRREPTVTSLTSDLVSEALDLLQEEAMDQS